MLARGAMGRLWGNSTPKQNLGGPMSKLLVRAIARVVILGAFLWLSAQSAAHASANLVADYHMNGSLASSVGSAPALVDIGTNSFVSESVDATTCNVLSFPQGNGLSLATNGVISSDTYSLVLLFRFDNVSSYRKIADFKNGTQDQGLYTLSDTLVFYADAFGIHDVIPANTYVQVVLTRDGATKQVTGYVDGTQEIQFTDTNDDAVIDSANTLRFFIDDQVTGGEESAGAVARIRLYDGVLTPSEVSALDRTPSDCGGPAIQTIQDTDTAIAYNSWQGVSDGSASGGSYRESNASGSKASIKFTGTSVQYFYRAAPNMGKVDVYIDKVKVRSLCLYAATPVNKKKTFKNLAAKKHLLELRVVNQTCQGSTDSYVSVDKLVAGTATYEDSALKWNWNGWSGKAASLADGGTYHSSKTAGARAALTFHGTGIQVLTLKGPSFGKLDVTIDNVLVETLDLANASLVKYTASYSGLGDADHTIVLSRNAGSDKNPVVVDGLRGPITLP
jgi:hypothetical protein